MEDTKKKKDQEGEALQNGSTKGEQCMLVVILTTLMLILIFLIVFAIHLALVKHTVMSDIFRAWEYDDDLYKTDEGDDSAREKSVQQSDYPIEGNRETIGHFTPPILPPSGYDGETKESIFGIKNAVIGIVYLNISSPRVLCNALKIKEQWSLVPGYCSALWSDSHLTEYVSAWLTRYYLGQDFVDLEVLRNVPHPHFNRNDFKNNIGLLEHYRPEKSVVAGSRSLPIKDSRRHFKTEILFINSIDDKSPLTMEVKRMTFNDCLSAIYAVAAPRSYEICYEFTVTSGNCVDHGGFLQEDSRTIGLFSWMNKCPDMELPFVVITLDSFSTWIADTTAVSSTDLENSG